MKQGKKVGWFLSGVLTALLVVSLASPAFAALAGKMIQVYTGVNVYVDDVLVEPRDANGNPVEVFVYNGTTYLPIRAIGNALGKTVQWDAKTSSAFVGKHSSDKPAVWLQDLDTFTGSGWNTKGSVKDNVGQTRTNCIQAASDSGYSNNTYILNGQYTLLSGTLFQPYSDRSDHYPATLEIYGDGELLYSAEMVGGVKPIDFTVDLTGVLELKVSFTRYNAFGYGRAMLSDCGLWT